MELTRFTEDGVTFSPPAYVQRYGAVCDLIKDDPRWSGQIQKVVDFGCAELSLFPYLKSIDGVCDVLEVDYDGSLLERFHTRAEPLFYDHLFQRETPLHVNVLKGSVSDPDYRLVGCDAVVAIELIEHLEGGPFDRMPHNIFGFIKPWIAIVTTPNAEFNVLFPNLKDGGFRHYDHKFEWTREQFESWANSVVSLYPDYTVEMSGIAPGPKGTENLGCCSQMAVFINRNYKKMENLDASLVEMDLSETQHISNHTTQNISATNHSCNQETNVGVSSDCRVDVEISPPCSVTSEDVIDENQNQDRLDYRDLVVEPMEEYRGKNSTEPFAWDCRVWENKAVTKYYTSIAEYDYPIYVDPRSREEKILDSVKGKLGSYCNYQHDYYDSDMDLWRLPLQYVKDMCRQFKDLTVDELRTILSDGGFELKDDHLIHKINYEDSGSCRSDHNDDMQYQDIEDIDVQLNIDEISEQSTQHEVWDTECPVDSKLWVTEPFRETGWETLSCVQQSPAVNDGAQQSSIDQQQIDDQIYERDKIPNKEWNMDYHTTVDSDQHKNSDLDMRTSSLDTNAVFANEQLMASQTSCTSGVESTSTVESDEVTLGCLSKHEQEKEGLIEPGGIVSKSVISTPPECDEAMLGTSDTNSYQSSAMNIVSETVDEILSNSKVTKCADKLENLTISQPIITCQMVYSNEECGSASNKTDLSIKKSYILGKSSNIQKSASYKLVPEFELSQTKSFENMSKKEANINRIPQPDVVKESDLIKHNNLTRKGSSNIDSQLSLDHDQLYTPIESVDTVIKENKSYILLNSKDILTKSSETFASRTDEKGTKCDQVDDNAMSNSSNVALQTYVGGIDVKQTNEQLHRNDDLMDEDCTDDLLSEKREDSFNTLCVDEKSPCSPLAQFCNIGKDKDGTEMLSDSGYLKSQDSPQSPNCSDSFSNDLITPDKDIPEMIQSTILECIPENLNCVDQSTSCSKGEHRNTDIRRKSIGPVVTLSTNEEFSGCSSMSRPKSLHVCTANNTDIDHGDFKSNRFIGPVNLEAGAGVIFRQQLANNLRNDINERLVLHRPQRDFQAPGIVEQNRPNFLDVQNMEVAVLDHQNNNVDFEGNNIDEDEIAQADLDADLIRQRMDMHNENHLVIVGGGRRDDRGGHGEREEGEEEGGAIVQEYREPCQLGGNYGCNPRILSARQSSPQMGTPIWIRSDSPSPLRDGDEEQDINSLIDSIEKTLSLQSKENMFLDESPCCSKTFYENSAPSTSKKYRNESNYNLERKKTQHCISTVLYDVDNTKRVSSQESELSIPDNSNVVSISNLLRSSGHGEFVSSNESSECNIVESKDTGFGLEGCLTVIGSHLNKCFSSAAFLDWSKIALHVSDDDDSTVDLDNRSSTTKYSSEENIVEDVVEPPIVATEKKTEPYVANEPTESRSDTSSHLEQYYSLEDSHTFPEWFIDILNQNPNTHEGLLNSQGRGFSMSERQAAGDGVGVHSYPSTHSSGHASMSSMASHTNRSVVQLMDQQVYSLLDLPYQVPPARDNYDSSSDSSIDLQIPIDATHNPRQDTCQCDYCETNNSDNTSHHNYRHSNVDATKINPNLANVLQQESMQDSSDDTYQSHSYRFNQKYATEVNCSSPEVNLRNDASQQFDCNDQPNSLIDLPDDLTFRNVDSFNDYEDAKSLGSCEFFKNSHYAMLSQSKVDNVSLRGVSSDMSGNYADVETDVDSEAD